MSTIVTTVINGTTHYVRKIRPMATSFMFEIGQKAEEAHDFSTVEAAAAAIKGCINHLGRKYVIRHKTADFKPQNIQNKPKDSRFS